MNKYILPFAVTGLALLSFGQLASAHEEDEINPRRVYQNEDPRYDTTRDNDSRYNDWRYNDSRYNDSRYDRRDRVERGGRLQYEVDHLNRMLAHVDRELRTYRADRRIWSEYRHIRAEARDLNARFRRGEQYYDRWRVRSQIHHMHDELHQIEERLQARATDWYQWR